MPLVHSDFPLGPSLGTALAGGRMHRLDAGSSSDPRRACFSHVRGNRGTRMKVKLPPAYAALHALSKSMDPALGEPMRFKSIDALKRAVRIEDVIAHCLEQEPQEVRGELRFHCLPTWHGGPDNNPSLWVNVEKQKWGCN